MLEDKCQVSFPSQFESSLWDNFFIKNKNNDCVIEKLFYSCMTGVDALKSADTRNRERSFLPFINNDKAYGGQQVTQSSVTSSYYYSKEK